MKLIFYFLCLAALLLQSCKKQYDWLEVKSSNTDVVPSKIKDYQAILDFDGYMNSSYPALPMLCCDNYYITPAIWASASTLERNAYTWNADILEGGITNDWNFAYKMIINANIALEGLTPIITDSSNRLAWNNCYGSALFYRAQANHNLLQTFAPPYDASTANTDMGIPLRMRSDVTQKIGRASLQNCYQQVLTDLQTAAQFLPETVEQKTRPSKPAAYALLARVSLDIADYVKAGSYADTALRFYNSLLDFNTLNVNAPYPFPTYQNKHPEVIFYAVSGLYGIIFSGIIDSTLYRSYATNDLRRTLFFKPSNDIVSFKGNYSGNSSPFSGIATNELYLIRAECAARKNDAAAAIADLNTLLQKRWKNGLFIPLTAATAEEALFKIINERRKELLFTGTLRWEDLRRLNKDPRFAISLTRKLNGESFSLPPNDKRYTLLIPDAEILLSGIQQNPR